VIPHVRLPIDADLFAPYEVIGEIGARPLQVYVARQSALAVGGAQLVVAEHFVGACKPGDAGAAADLRREARRISTLANPHIARVREVAVRGDDLVVFGDFLDGEKLTKFWSPGAWLPLEMTIRVLLDVLTGLGALHGLRDSTQQPMKLTHGEISPATVLFGSDGVARVLHAVARRAADATAEAASLPYLAPEVHANDAYDGRADVFSVGVLLWEALEGKHLSEGGEPAGVRVRSASLPAPTAPENAPWAKGLVPVAVKALAAQPEDRWPTAAAMAAEIRKAAGLKLAAASAAAAFAKNKFGDRAKERRARWEARPSLRPPGAPAPSRELSLASAVALAASSQVADVPISRSEEFSSSVLESYRPPPPPHASAPAPIHVPLAPRAAEEGASSDAQVHVDAEVEGPRSAPADASGMAQIDALFDDPGGARFNAPRAPKDSGLSIPPLLSSPATSIPEPPPSAEAMVPFEAPVVFDEVAPIPPPFGDPSPMPPALSTSDAPVGARSRRRHLLIGGAAALGVAIISVVAVGASRHAPPPPVAAVQATPQPASPAAQPAAAAASTPALVLAGPATQAAAPAPPPASTTPPHPAMPKAKPTPKAKPPSAAPAHGKSGPVRPQTRSKPGSP